MRKQAILLVTTFIFAISLCGAVAAENNTTTEGVIQSDSDTSENSDTNSSFTPENLSLKENIILGQVLDCETNEPFPNVTVTARNNVEILANTITDVDGKYKLRFLSNLTTFNITASSPNHKSSTTKVNTTLQKDENETTYTANANLKLGKPKALFLFQAASTLNVAVLDSIDNCPYFTGTYYIFKDLPPDIKLTDYDLVWMDYLYQGTPNLNRLLPLINYARQENTPMIMTTSFLAENPVGVIIANGNSEYQWIRDYWANKNPENLKNLMTYLSIKFFNVTTTVTPPIIPPKEGIYHPDANQLYPNLTSYLNWYSFKYDANKPTVAITIQQRHYNQGNTAAIDAIIQGFEAKGVNVIPYVYDDHGNPRGEPDIQTYLMKDGKCIADLIVYQRGTGGWNTVASLEDVQSELQLMNVPVILAYVYDGTYQEWLNASQGSYPLQFSYIAITEMHGIFDPILVATNELDPRGATRIVPVERQINWLIESAISIMSLRYKVNSEKKVAIIYWSPTGKDKGAGASHLDVYASIPEVLEAMKQEGYNLGTDPLPDVNQLVELIRNQGLNVGIWAPGELKKLVENYPVVLVPEEEYLTWFNSLNAVKRQEIIDMWGEPPGDIMMYEKDGKKYLVLPVIQFGNVILAPEPSRGYNQDYDALYHSGDVPPNHQYLAFYFWLKQGFNADAEIHFGRHGSAGWLPGKSGMGLDIENCWPAIVTQNIPIIYLFTVEGSESTMPKRRQQAVIISHMIPPMTISGLYGDLATLHTKIHQYETTTDVTVQEEYKKSIIQLVKNIKINEDLQLNMDDALNNFNEFLDNIHLYLHDLESTFITNGLHIFGEAPTGDKLIYTVQSLLGYDFREYMEQQNLTDEQVKQLLDKVLMENKTVSEAQNSVLGKESPEMTNYLTLAIKYAGYVNQSTNELKNMLRALDGKYITTGSIGDPVITPEVLPTGRNLYSFDPRIIPSAEAWNVGSKLAQDLIDQYIQENGEYPKKVSFMLWATHTIQDKGVMEAEIMYLLGIEPVRGDLDVVTGVKLIENLERPRIDVLITTTALYLNDYKYTLDILDKAIRLAATANDTAYPNYVKVNSEAVYQTLIKKGYSEEDARNVSKSRIFSQEPGNHHNPLENAISMGSTWETDQKLADSFIETFGNVYGMDGNSVHMSDLYRLNLVDSQVAMFRRYVNANDLLSSEDYSAYFGGLGMAIRSASGNDPLMLISNLENPKNPHLESLSTSLAKDVRTTYYNPKWIQAIQGHGASGARRITSFIDNLYIWDVTSPNSVTNGMWDDAYNVYVKDKYNLGLKEWFDKSNPYAAQAIYAKMMESSRKNYWQTDDATKRDLSNRWAESIIANGVSCCDCSCGNLAMVEWATQYVNPDILAQFNAQMYKSTQNPGFAPSTPQNPTNPESPSNPTNPSQPEQPEQSESSSGTTPGEQQVSAASTPGDAGDQGKSHEINPVNQQNSSQQTGMPVAAIVGVVLIVGLIGVGYFRTSIMDFLRK